MVGRVTIEPKPAEPAERKVELHPLQSVGRGDLRREERPPGSLGQVLSKRVPMRVKCFILLKKRSTRLRWR
jgi:hypothetical protein